MIRAAAQSEIRNPQPEISLPHVISVAHVADWLGRSHSAARRLLVELEAAGLRRKGRGRGTCYDRREFLSAWNSYDTRP